MFAHDGGQYAEKNELKPHLNKYWCIPPEQDAGFVAAMEDVLSIYSRDFKQDEVLVCLDETSKQLVSETRKSIPMKSGSVEKHDAEYKRNGTANIFMVNAPLHGERYVRVTEARKAIDYAEILRELSDEIYPDKNKIILVQDNLNTHETSSLYKRFEPAQARRLAERFEFIILRDTAAG